MSAEPIPHADLRAAYDRAWTLRFLGISFERALADPLIRRGLQQQAISHRRICAAIGRALPAQSTLALEP